MNLFLQILTLLLIITLYTIASICIHKSVVRRSGVPIVIRGVSVVLLIPFYAVTMIVGTVVFGIGDVLNDHGVI